MFFFYYKLQKEEMYILKDKKRKDSIEKLKEKLETVSLKIWKVHLKKK